MWYFSVNKWRVNNDWHSDGEVAIVHYTINSTRSQVIFGIQLTYAVIVGNIRMWMHILYLIQTASESGRAVDPA